MNKKFLLWENPKQAILTMTLFLLIMGCINVFSASFVAAKADASNPFHYLQRYIMFAVLFFMIMLAIKSVNYKRLLNSKFLWISFWVTSGLLLLVKLVGTATKGAARWLPLGPFSLQPSEIAKLVVIVIAAGILGRLMKKGQQLDFYDLLLEENRLLGIATIVFSLFIFLQPDLGTAAIVVALTACMLVLAGLEMKYFWKTLGLLLILAVVATVSSEYRLNRIKVWLDPWIDQKNLGYQMVQSQIAIGSGGFTGTDWGHGSAKLLYLPEAHTDFAFAVFCQENGLLGACLMILFFCILVAAFTRIICHTKDERGFLLASGATLLVVGQAVANMAMVVGYLPVIGVPLTFISYGGSSMLVSMLAIGLILSVYENEVKREKLEATPPETRRQDMRFTSGTWSSERRWPK